MYNSYRQAYNMIYKTTLFELFLVSYIPLFVILGIQNTNDNFQGTDGTRLELVEYLLYLATYIILFIGLNFDERNNLLATTLLFLIIGFTYIKTNLLYTTPTLALFGYYISLAKIEADTLTLQDPIQYENPNSRIPGMLKRGYGFVSIGACLLDAKKIINSLPECLDVFVTQNGKENKPVLGLITNNMILEKAKA